MTYIERRWLEITSAHAHELRTGDQGPQIGDLWPVAGTAASRYHENNAVLAEGKGAVMTHVVVRIIELLLAIGLTAAVTAMFALAVICAVHGLHSAGRQH